MHLLCIVQSNHLIKLNLISVTKLIAVVVGYPISLWTIEYNFLIQFFNLSKSSLSHKKKIKKMTWFALNVAIVVALKLFFLLVELENWPGNGRIHCCSNFM